MRRKNSEVKKSKLVGIDFFSGSGGVTNGFIKAQIEMLAGIDIDEQIKGVFELNNSPAKFFQADITDEPKNLSIIESVLSRVKHDHAVFAACAPCQPFSSQNRNFRHDSRKSLLLHFAEIIEKLDEEMRPSFLFVENVGPMQLRGKEILSEILNKIHRMNYFALEPKIIDASLFGVPQKRKRLIFIALNTKKVKIDPAVFNWDYFFNKHQEKIKTVKDAIGHLPKIKAGEIDQKDPLHRSRKLSPLNLKRIKKIDSPGGSRNMWGEELVLECHKKYSGHSDVYGRMFWDKPSPTITTKCTGLSNGRFGHPEQNRAISLREAAILQTMEDFEFGDDMAIDKIARYIGNAVPPYLAYKFGEFFFDLLKANE